MQINILKNLSTLDSSEKLSKNFQVVFNINDPTIATDKVTQTISVGGQKKSLNASNLTQTFDENGNEWMGASDVGSRYGINGWLVDEEFLMGTDNNWVELHSLVAGGALEQLNNFLVGTGNASLRTKKMYTKIWSGSQTNDYKIGVVFQAESDPKKDVWDKVWNLYKLSVPYGTSAPKGVTDVTGTLENLFNYGNELWKDVPVLNMLSNLGSKMMSVIHDVVSSTFLGSPGQQVVLESVEIGNMIILDKPRVKNISVSFPLSSIGKKAIDSDKERTYPMSAKVEVTLMTNTIYTIDDINKVKNDKTLTSTGNTAFNYGQ